MKKIWIVALIAVVAAAGWHFRAQVPFLDRLSPQAPEDRAASAETPKDGGRNGQRGRGNGQPAAVKTVAAVKMVLPLDVTATGAAVADENTTIAAQEAGTVLSIAAHDGDVVKAGDLIAKLDDRSLVAALDKDKALLARDEAALRGAETALARAKTLVDRSAGTQQSVDEAQATRDTSAATVQSDRATIAADQVNLEHTQIRAPFDGRLGDIAVSVGAYLGVGSAVVTIEKYDPIHVSFHLSEGYLGQLRRGFSGGEIKVDALPQSSSDEVVSGKLSFFDNTVDTASGTILAKAQFDNPDGELWPGQSVNVTVHFNGGEEKVVVPTVAVNPGADSPFVYTIGDDRKAHKTLVTVSRSNGSDTAIAKGIEDGAHVVVEGQSQLADGVTVHEDFSDTARDTASVNAVIEAGASN